MTEPKEAEPQARSVSSVLEKVKRNLPDVPEYWSELRVLRQSEDVYIVRIYERETGEFEAAHITF
jgi:hypothetical protein